MRSPLGSWDWRVTKNRREPLQFLRISLRDSSQAKRGWLILRVMQGYAKRTEEDAQRPDWLCAQGLRRL